ncbi:hypothetical protein BVI061214_00334 [Thermus aquaticus]|uniref:Uncharacterized protein n=1 Tax=Thermus aquaticus TaxID=271 RepID=A0A0N0BL93_THEAQ|nr:hypothetical protein BVI061214_00334 [Thermus aquaticus]
MPFGRGGEGDDGLSPLAPGRPPDEVQLAAEAGVDAGADGVRHHLAGQVHLYGGVDGHHLAVLGDDEGVVDVVRRVELKEGVVVDEAVKPFRAQDEGAHDLARVEGLPATRDEPLFQGLHHPVGDHLRVDAQVPAALEAGQDGVGDGPDAHLQGGPVLYEACHVFPDAPFHLPEPLPPQLGQGVVHLHDGGEAGDVDEGVPQGSRHPGIHHGDDDGGHLQGRLGGDDLHAQGAEAVLVGRGDLDDSGVQGQDPALEEPGDLVEHDGHVVGPALVYRIPVGGAHEEGAPAEVALHLRPGKGVVAHLQEVDELHPFQLVLAGRQGLEDGRGCGGVAGDEDPHPRPDQGDGVLGGGQLLAVAHSRWPPFWPRTR